MIEIIPGILENDWETTERQIRIVAPYVSWVQIGIADGTLVPMSSHVDFGPLPPLITSLRKPIFFEAHLMVVDPVKYLRPLIDNGFTRFVVHVESQDPREFLAQASYESVDVCMAIDTASEVAELESFVDEIDGVVVMTAEAGVEGREFVPETVEKITTIHQNYSHLPIEVDGGINDQSIKIVKDAGATRIVSTSFIYKDLQGIEQAIQQLRSV